MASAFSSSSRVSSISRQSPTWALPRAFARRGIGTRTMATTWLWSLPAALRATCSPRLHWLPAEGSAVARPRSRWLNRHLCSLLSRHTPATPSRVHASAPSFRHPASRRSPSLLSPSCRPGLAVPNSQSGSSRRRRRLLGVHAYRSGRLLLDCGVPYVIVLGGTDMNEHLNELSKRAVIVKVLKQAAAIIAFDDNLLGKAVAAVPTAYKAFRVPQAVDVCPPPTPPTDAAGYADAIQSIRAELSVPDPADRLLLLPAGLRPVKDVLFGLAHSTLGMPKIRPSRCASWGRGWRRGTRRRWKPRSARVLRWRTAARCPARSFTSPCVLLRVFSTPQARRVCATQILEAMKIGTPVLARANAGNAALVEDGTTGLLFRTPDELVAQGGASWARMRGRAERRRPRRSAQLERGSGWGGSAWRGGGGRRLCSGSTLCH